MSDFYQPSIDDEPVIVQPELVVPTRYNVPSVGGGSPPAGPSLPSLANLIHDWDAAFYSGVVNNGDTVGGSVGSLEWTDSVGGVNLTNGNPGELPIWESAGLLSKPSVNMHEKSLIPTPTIDLNANSFTLGFVCQRLDTALTYILYSSDGELFYLSNTGTWSWRGDNGGIATGAVPLGLSTDPTTIIVLGDWLDANNLDVHVYFNGVASTTSGNPVSPVGLKLGDFGRDSGNGGVRHGRVVVYNTMLDPAGVAALHAYFVSQFPGLPA